MKNWNEANNYMTVYVRDSFEFENEDGVMVKSKPFQKATLMRCFGDIQVNFEGGEYDGYDFYWYPEKDNPNELLTEDEYQTILGKIVSKEDLIKALKYAHRFASENDGYNKKYIDDILNKVS